MFKFQDLQLVGFSAYALDFDDLVFTGLQAMEL